MNHRAPFAIALLAALAAPRAVDAEADPVADRARAILDAQLAAIGDPSAFLATLTSDAVIVGNGSFTLARGNNASAIIATLTAGSDAAALQVQATRIDAGAVDDVLWLSADIVMTHGWRRTRRGGFTRVQTTARLLEVVVADGETWKVVALSFASTSGTTAPGDALAPAGSGALTALLASRDKLDGALRDDPTTIVQGWHDELGVGREAARRVFAAWRYREPKVNGAVEVRSKAWGFVAGDISIAGDPHASFAAPIRVPVLLFAVAERGRWKVVAVHATEDCGSACVKRDPLAVKTLDGNVSHPIPTIDP